MMIYDQIDAESRRVDGEWWQSAATVLDMTVVEWAFRRYATFTYVDDDGRPAAFGVGGVVAERLIKVGQRLAKTESERRTLRQQVSNLQWQIERDRP